MLLLSTSSLKWYSIHKIFILAKKAWVDGLNLDIEKLNYDSWDWDYLKSLSDAFDLPILAITAPDKWMDERKVDQIVNIAIKLKSQVITFSPPHMSDKKTSWFTWYLDRKRKETLLSIAVQNVEQKYLLFIIPEYKSNNLVEIKRLTGQTSLNIWNIDKSSWIDILKARTILWNTVKNIYLSDKKWAKSWLLPGQAGWGTSHLPLESFLMKLKSNWYTWYFTLKVIPWELWAWNDEKVLQNLDYMKKYYRRHFLDFKQVD